MAKIGIIGCGGMGAHHSRTMSKIDAANIVACSDVKEDARAKLAQAHNIPNVFADYSDLLELHEVDAVFVCLPTFLHHDAVVAAAKAGKDIFCEKPISMSLDDAQEMIDESKKNNVKLVIGFVRRFDNFWGKLRELIQSDVIGRPVLWRQCAASGGPRQPWFNDAQKGGGPLIDGAVHNHDFNRYMFGEAELVMGSMKTYKSDSTALDTGTGLVRFRSGDEVMLSWSWGLPNGCTAQSLNDVLGPKGAILFGAPADKFPAGATPQTHGGYTVNFGDGESRVEVYEKNDMFFDEVSHFIDCVDKDEDPKVTGVDGKRALEIGLAILESSRAGQSVAIKAD